MISGCKFLNFFVMIVIGFSLFSCAAAMGSGAASVGVFRGSTTWLLDASGDGKYGAGDLMYSGFGKAGDVPVTGDWNGDGNTEIGVVRNSNIWLLDASGDGKYGAGDFQYSFGKTGDVPVTGDWNNDWITEIGVFRSGTTWLLDASGDGAFGAGDLTYAFGKAGDVPVTGDWNGYGPTKIGVFRSGTTWLLDASGDGKYGTGDYSYSFGKAGDAYVIGDWNNNWITEIGVVRNSNSWLLDASGDGKYGAGDYSYSYGKAGDVPVTGEWPDPVPVQTEYKVYAEVGDTVWGLESAENFFNKIKVIDRSGITWAASLTPNGEGVVKGQDVHVSHWTTYPEQWIGNADFVFFTGHGNYGVFAFPDGQANVFIYGLNKTGKVKWAAFDSCRTIHDDYEFTMDNPFLKSFDKGLHMLLGYDTDVGNNNDYPNGEYKGEIFADLMKGDYWNNSHTMTIQNAWYWAGVYSHLRYSGQGPVRSAAIYATNCGDDMLPGYGNSCSNPGSGFTQWTREVFPEYEPGTLNSRTLNLAVDNYSLETSVPVASGNAFIYTPVKSEYNKEWVSSLAKSLGMSGNILETDDIFYADDIDAKQFYFVVQKNTSMISFQKLNRNSDIVQSETRSQSAADTFLRNYNLMPSEYLETTVANNSAVRISRTGKNQVISKTNVIWYPQRINGLPVFGARSMVEVDSEGNIITLFKNWREYEPYKEMSLKSPEDAFKEFRIRQSGSNLGIPEKVNITRVSLGYQIQKSGNLAEYLEPVYIFEGYCQNGDIQESFNPAIIKAGLTDLSTVT
jgi:hypothetical protein